MRCSRFLSLTLFPAQFFVYNETPLFLQLSRYSIGKGKELPLTIYESNIEVIEDQPEVVFSPVGYEIETGEAERVAVDHASKPSGAGDGGESSRSSSRPF